MKTIIKVTAFLQICMIHNAKAQWTQTNGPLSAEITSIVEGQNGTLYAGTNGVYSSTNNGASWNITSGSPRIYVPCLTFNPAGDSLFASFAGQGVKYFTGSAWNTYGTGLPTNFPVKSMIHQTQGILLAGTLVGGVYKHTGLGWTSLNTGLTGNAMNVLSLTRDNSGVIYAGTQGGVYKLTGSTWSPMNAGLNNLSIQKIIFDPVTNTLFCGIDSTGNTASTQGGVYKWNGSSWSGLMIPGAPCVSALGINTVGDIYAGTSNNFTGSGNKVFISTSSSNGNVWTPSSTGFPRTRILSFAFTGSGTIFCGTFSGIFISTNNAISWAESNTGLLACNSNRLAASCSGKLFSATAGDGIFVSTDFGAN